MPVSAATEAKLRAAMARLLAAQPQHTSGALTKSNLAREAQVSHATMHRGQNVLAEWDAQVACPVLRTPGETARDESIAVVRRQLREAKATVTELQSKLDALAAVTANLYYEKLALKKRDNNRRLAPFPSAR
ncbi:hypothetical protein AB0F96_39825 [Streptomyces sp. NPDC023998]|uniref:hypothetical protein n=1 Tax=Streptomyces sp. NPDC023998 TaxID=3154597 RepID=UPI0033CDA8F9